MWRGVAVEGAIKLFTYLVSSPPSPPLGIKAADLITTPSSVLLLISQQPKQPRVKRYVWGFLIGLRIKISPGYVGNAGFYRCKVGITVFIVKCDCLTLEIRSLIKEENHSSQLIFFIYLSNHSEKLCTSSEGAWSAVASSTVVNYCTNYLTPYTLYNVRLTSPSYHVKITRKEHKIKTQPKCNRVRGL